MDRFVVDQLLPS